MVTAIERTYKARRGDAWKGETFRFIKESGAGFWTNPVAAAQLRATKNGPVAHTFTLNPVITMEGVNAVLTLSINLSPTDSGKLNPGTYVGDIEAASDSCPKSTFITFILEIVNDVTRP
jgi:hypothetical protein